MSDAIVERVEFGVPEGISLRSLHLFNRHAKRIGLIVETVLPDLNPPMTYENLSELSPLIDSTSYMGTEHFTVYGEQTDIPPVSASVLFGVLVCPVSKNSASDGGNKSRADSFVRKGIIVGPREEVGLPELPAHLKTVSLSKSRRLADEKAIQVGSVLMFSDNMRWLSDIKNFGKGQAKNLKTISEALRQNLYTS